MEFKQVLKAVKRAGWFIAVIVLLATSCITFYSYYYIEPLYEASTKLILIRSDDTLSEGRVDYNTLLANGMLMDTYTDIVKTPRIMDHVVAQYPELETTKGELMSIVSVHSSNNQIMSIVVQDYSYSRAVQVANSVSQVLINEIPKIMKINNIDILDEASEQNFASQVTPNPVMNGAIAFVVSFMASAALVLVRAYLRDTLEESADVEALLGTSVIAVIPKMKKNEICPVAQTENLEKAGDQHYVAVNQ